MAIELDFIHYKCFLFSTTGCFTFDGCGSWWLLNNEATQWRIIYTIYKHARPFGPSVKYYIISDKFAANIYVTLIAFYEGLV